MMLLKIKSLRFEHSQVAAWVPDLVPRVEDLTEGVHVCQLSSRARLDMASSGLVVIGEVGWRGAKLIIDIAREVPINVPITAGDS